MKYAVRQRFIDSNPVQEVEKPKERSRYNESDEMDILRPDEIRRLLDHVEGLKYQTLFMLAAISGACQGEILGLTWSVLIMIDQGEHPKYIQTQMGHSSINVTMDTYGHLMNTVNQESAKRLDSTVFKTNGDILETFSGVAN